MLMRSGFLTKPSPLVEFDWGSQSTSSVLTSAAASEAARLMAVVVLPTPPFWLATAMTRPMILFSRCCGPEYANASAKSMPIAVQNVTSVPRGTSAICFTRNTSAGTYSIKIHKIEKCSTWNTVAWIRLIMRLLAFVTICCLCLLHIGDRYSTIAVQMEHGYHSIRVHQLTILLHVTGGLVSVDAISEWLGLPGGESALLLPGELCFL